MSRLNRYRDSLNKFIKEKSAFLKDVPRDIEQPLHNILKRYNLLLPILFLTVMNSQNKKHSVSLQGYYAASGIQMLYILHDLADSKERFVQKYGYDCYGKVTSYLLFYSNRLVVENLESVKDHIPKESLIEVMSLYNRSILIFHDQNLDFLDTRTNLDLEKWYLKNDPKLLERFREIKQVSDQSFNQYVIDRMVSVCNGIISISWLIGCGNIEELDKVKRISKYFSLLYKLTDDYNNLDEDIENGNHRNFIINYGLQNSYETFMFNKQKFIEECMMMDIFTNTIKELVNYMQRLVDDVIDETSPDLKSNLGSLDTNTFEVV